MNARVSIIVPCFNEENTIGLLLETLRRQSYDLALMEVVIADGMSTDGTRQRIETFSDQNPALNVRVVDNAKRIIPAALNRAIENAKGDILIRLDAHSAPRGDYVERCVAALHRTGAANVGGAWDIQPLDDGWMSRAIAVAAAHPLGAGDARYRTGGAEGEVDTVPFGAFPRRWIEQVGLFEEDLETNEDYEFNVRLRRAGGVVWFDPSIRSTYYARPDFLSLAKQYARYGYWKARMLLRYPTSLRWRQVLPPLFVNGLIVLGLLAVFFKPAWWLFGVALGTYGAVTVIAGLISGLRTRDPGAAFGFPIALWTMHFAWGAAFTWGVLRGLGRRRA